MRFTSQAQLVEWSTGFVEIAGDGCAVVRPIANEPMTY